MTPEQFVFWISGYFAHNKLENYDHVVDQVRDILKQVKLDRNQYVVFET
jgi:hypothetical protein